MKKERNKKSSKYSLLKILGISFLVFAILTWFIPAGIISQGTYTQSTDGTMPVGLLGLFINPVYSFGIFVQYFLVFLAIGGLYGVLNKTGVYSKLVDSISNKVSKHKTLGLIIITLLFTLISAIVGNQIALFILVPFAIAILVKSGFGKVTSIAATVGAIIVGIAGSIFGTDVVFVSFFAAKPFYAIVSKLIFFIIITALYTLFLLYQSGLILKNRKKGIVKEETIDDVEIPLYSVAVTKRSCIPLIILLVIMSLLIFAGCLNWDYSFGITLFTDLNTSMTKINFLSKLLGYIPVIGYFGNYDVVAIILLFTFLIKWIYSIKFDEFIDGFVDGAKKMIKPALYAILASVIFAVMVNNNYNICATILDFILKLNSKFYVLTMTLVGFVGGYFFNDFPYLVNGIYSSLTNYGTLNISVMSTLIQTGYAIAMLSLPVSVTLIAGLKYLNVSYKSWMKYIYKFLLLTFVLAILFGLIVLAI